jgi:hypothetical protein|tara:strand:- start:119 stop:283 length:165 start_codon:yes stop_codon:yes gene_type:complete
LIKPLGLFYTPQDWDELMEWINRHNTSERPHIMTAAAMGYNLAAKQSQKETQDV